MSSPTQLIFLKLGGSLITNKDRPRTLRPDVLARLAGEIARAMNENPGLRLLIGHGSGSFGHVPARQYGTRQGVHTPAAWRGFGEVWREANLLNRHVMDALLAAGLASISLPASAGLIAEDGQVTEWNLEPYQRALDAGLIPVVFGDVIFDRVRGGTIFSTENLFDHLARKFQPGRLLLAGIEQGVYADFPVCENLIPLITPGSFAGIASALGGSASTDVTGGMASKVGEMLELVKAVPDLEVQIFSGMTPDVLYAAMAGACPGTKITESL